MKKIIFILFVFISCISRAFPQYPPAAGEPGSTAIFKDDASFTGWATTCKATRGFINIADTLKTFTQNRVTSNRAFFGTEAMGTGKPGGATDCISLGDGGTAVLTFGFPVRDGEGADFAVFENGIREQESPFQYFLELAFVEVSTDGKRFVRFPAVSNTPVQEQIPGFGQIDPTRIHNFAGKYVANYGTPFDLQELRDSAGINLDSINFIRVMDVVGSIAPQYARYDSRGLVVNDPYPTEFWTGGFDLDAVGAIHLNSVTAIRVESNVTGINVYPNPVTAGGSLLVQAEDLTSIELWSDTGKKLEIWETGVTNSFQVHVPTSGKGLLLLKVRTEDAVQTIKLMVE